jgi:dolichyl-phosphate-mannose-protein mannosyltransferase
MKSRRGLWQLIEPVHPVAARARLFIAAIAVLALLLRLAPILSAFTWTNLGGDSSYYIQHADGLRAGCGYAPLVGGHCAPPDAFRPPGYPLFLALAHGIPAVFVIQAALQALVCWLLGEFVASWWGPSAGVITAALLATDVPSILFASLVMTEALFQSLIALAILLEMRLLIRPQQQWKPGLALLIGFFFALGAMVRSNGVMFALVGAAAILLGSGNWRYKVGYAAAILALPIIVIGGWAFRNHRVLGVGVFDGDGPHYLYFVKAAGVVSYQNQEPLARVRVDFARDFRLPDDSWLNPPPLQWSRRFSEKALAIMLAHPIALVGSTLKGAIEAALIPDYSTKLKTLLGLPSASGCPDDLGWRTSLPCHIRNVKLHPMPYLAIALQVPLVLFMWIGMGLTCAGIRRLNGPGETGAIVFLIATVAVSLTPASVFFTMPRLRIPLIPLLAILSGTGWCDKVSAAQSQFSRHEDRDGISRKL